ncbi:hypothetical protein TSAR_014243 [Trichomalopsis sarcophagae]|uniref:Uncharacterized protein n=1 Tax=Trichomalopsis sarcophagae TaxID=543379 RepID=A0A232FK22_9HYME|nr:hypothetical protein TSAR_014243 [Trichomalopsis sarcophagae]
MHFQDLHTETHSEKSLENRRLLNPTAIETSIIPARTVSYLETSQTKLDNKSENYKVCYDAGVTPS